MPSLMSFPSELEGPDKTADCAKVMSLEETPSSASADNEQQSTVVLKKQAAVIALCIVDESALGISLIHSRSVSVVFGRKAFS